jgi:hypothetical protein
LGIPLGDYTSTPTTLERDARCAGFRGRNHTFFDFGFVILDFGSAAFGAAHERGNRKSAIRLD